LYISSNGLHATADLADRALIIRTLGRDHHEYRGYPEGYLLEHVRANQPYILGCIYSVLSDWVREGRVWREDTPHRVQPWANMCAWIVEHYFETPPLMEGHEAVQTRASDSGQTAIRELCVAVQKAGKVGVDLFARDLAGLAAEHNVRIPGLRPDSTEEQS